MEAIRRFFEPAAVAGSTVIVVAAIGVVINTATALMFMSGRKGDLNIRGAYLHMAADAAVSAGVVVAGFIMMRTGWLWLDPAVSLAIAAIIAIGTWGLLRDSVAMSLHAAPPGIDPETVKRLLHDLPGVRAIHDLHIWPMSTTETALTVHLVMPAGHPGDAAIRTITDKINDRFGIGHCTIQVETRSRRVVRARAEPCRLARLERPAPMCGNDKTPPTSSRNAIGRASQVKDLC